MTRYLVTANIWLLIALTLFVGRTYERDSPTRYSVFHGGQWFSLETYSFIILAVLAVAAFFFFLTWTTRNRP